MTDDIWLLDLCSGAGGATKGYQRAGFKVCGVDIAPQPNYCGERFLQADAFQPSSWPLWMFARDWDAVHVSPPCQRFSDLAKRNRNGHEWPDFIDDARSVARGLSNVWVIENVEGAPLTNPMRLCGTMFPELRVIRHRLFESCVALRPLGFHPKHPLVFTHDKRKAHYGRLDQDTSFVQVTGGGNATLANKLDAMGIDWMKSHHEVNEAIPPAYTRWVGSQLMEVVLQ